MNRRTAFTALAALAGTALASAPAAAQNQPPRELSYEVHQGGQHTLLRLRITGSQVSGTLNEGSVQLDLRGELNGRRLQGQLFLAGAAVPLAALQGELQTDQLDAMLHTARGGEAVPLTMRRVGAPAPVAPAGGGLDPQLVGQWQQQSMTNSSGGAGGFASFTTLRTLVLSADGRVQQSMRSVGGGAGWSHRSGSELEFSGRWQTRNGSFWVLVDGQTAFQNVGRYQLVDGRLVLHNGSQRQIWRR